MDNIRLLTLLEPLPAHNKEAVLNYIGTLQETSIVALLPLRVVDIEVIMKSIENNCTRLLDYPNVYFVLADLYREIKGENT